MSDTVTVEVAVDEATVTAASRVFAERGWSIAEAVRVLLVRTAMERVVPLTPHAETVAAIDAGKRGEVTRFSTVGALMADLRAEP